MIYLLKVPPGKRLDETIKIMNLLSNVSKNNQTFVKWVFNTFAQNCNDCIFKKVWEFIQNNFNYVDDIYDETIQAPHLMPYTKEGDCDDFSLFIKTVLEILGFKPEYLLLGRDKYTFTHIAVICNGIVIDGTNVNFNVIPKNKYKFFRKI